MDLFVSHIDTTVQKVYAYDATPKAQPPVVDTYGAICAGSQSRFARASFAPNPRFGRRSRVHLRSARPQSLATLLAHLSRSTPPLDLSPLGMPSCWMHIPLGGPTLPPIQVGSDGSASLVMDIPNDSQLAGSQVTFQWIVVDPGTNAAGIVTSNGIDIRIGAH